ncbi:Imm21 family immunity protein [Kitasatospora sp. KL5]|uniref:Imm21 family immunity protein n=1 Tax=Kitasatospora sp. KL5 TaxID=3425125 RepID=UPI003D6DDDB4
MVRIADPGMFEWVSSGGGPLIAMPQAVLQSWHGCDFESTSTDDDYGRACEVDDHVGVIPVGPAGALVLRDPDLTTYLPEYGVFVRWHSGESEDAVLDTIELALRTATWEAETVWRIQGPLVLFDSGRPGTPRPGTESDHDDRLAIDIPAGHYAVRSAHVTPNPQTCLTLVQLAQLDDE